MTVKPFLKWVGGKRQLLADIAPLIPNEFSRYVEPFVGGGAVFFHLSEQIIAQQTPSVINDINPELVNCYQIVKTQTDDLISLLKTHKHDPFGWRVKNGQLGSYTLGQKRRSQQLD